MILGTTTDKIQIITTTTADIHVVSSFADMDDTTKAVTVDRQLTAITSAATTDVVAAPASGFSRKLKSMHIANSHASNGNDVTIQYNANGTIYILEKVTLLAGERLSYREGVPMRVVNAAGLEKTIANSNPSILTKRSLANHAISSTTATEVTDLSLACGIGTWMFEYSLIFRSATATVGPKLSVNYDGTVTTFLYEIHSIQVNTADSLGALDQDATALQVVGGFAARAKSTAAGLIGTVGVDTINLDILLSIRGLAIVTVAGNFELWHGSETATSTTIMADSCLRLTKVET